MRHESVAQLARVRSLLESIDDPCWVLDPDGRPIARNAAARSELTMPYFVLDFVAGRTFEIPRGCRIRHISLDGASRIFAMGRRRGGETRFEFESLGLAGSLVEVAEHLTRGFSDVEISLLTGRPLGIVHTFIVHVHRQLGVSTRSELAEFVQRARESTRPLPPDRTGPTVQARARGWLAGSEPSSKNAGNR